MFGQRQAYDPVNLEEGTGTGKIPTATPASAISSDDLVPRQRVNVIPDTIRPPRIMQSSTQNLPPSIGKRVAIALSGAVITLIIFSQDEVLFSLYHSSHLRWIEILALTELIVSLAFGIGSFLGFVTGKWEALVPGFVIYKGMAAFNMVVFVFAFLTGDVFLGH